MPEIKNDPVLFIAGIFGLLVIGWQTWMNYRKSTFDVTLALNYRKILFDDKKPERYAASVAALEALNVPKDQREKVDILEMEPVLDEFEDIGFLLHNGQISDEVVFHYFSHWVQMEIPQWVDSPGTYHGGGCGFAFADAIQNPIIGPVRRPKLGSNAQLWRIQMTCETGIGCGYGLPPIFRALCRHPDKTVRTKTLRFLAISDTAI